MIKLVFSDLDGTFLFLNNPRQAGVSAENRQALQKLRDHNIEFMIATGRHHSFLPRIMGLKEDYFNTIGWCGAEILYHKELIYHISYTKEDLLLIMNLFAPYSKHANIFFTNLRNEVIFYDIQHPQYQRFLSFHNMGLPKDYTKVYEYNMDTYLEKHPETDSFRICIFFDKPEDGHAYMAELSKKGNYCFVAAQRNSLEVEILREGMNKGKAIELIMTKLNLHKEEIAVIGDSGNDLEMFRLVPLSFAMKHSTPEILALSKYTVESVAEAVAMIIALNNNSL